MKKSLLFILCLGCIACGKKAKTDTFAWNKATVYFVLVDRFCNGDTTNDQQYGRCTDYGSERMNASTFHGGDYAGLLQKAKEGYFTSLGVDVVWLTDPYEQVHGWLPGSGWLVNDFPHYGYHGYYPLDYTQMDKNYGTIAEYRALIDELHAQGIRVMQGANINDIGYPTYLDALQQGFATVPGIETEAQAVEHCRDIDYGAWLTAMYDNPDWYTTDWLRRPIETDDPLQMTLYGLPDYLTEKTEPVNLPAFLHRKWQREGNSNDDWTWPTIKALRKDTALAPDDYVIRYIAAWVEEFGIDGFRCDVVGYVHPWRWKQLHEACNEALNNWRKKHPEQAASKWTDEVMFTGDYDDAYITHLPLYEQNGFNSMVNMVFPKDGNLTTIIDTWQAYSDSMAVWQEAGYSWYPFSYLNNAYFRDADMNNMDKCATCFLLSPGAVQIFYGDEIARQTTDAILNVDAAQAFRSDYDWTAPNDTLMAHYQTLCAFRKTHPAVGAGRQTIIDAQTVVRISDNDTVVIALNPQSGMRIAVPFSDGERVRDAYSGEETIVQDGVVVLQRLQSHVALLETDNSPRMTPCAGNVESMVMQSNELGKTMKVDVWLPEGYGTSSQRYPVLYMHDGQNLFDATKTWNHQEWGVDEAITQLAAEGMPAPIVVAIYNDQDRGVDYMPANYYEYLSDEQLKTGINLEGFAVTEPHSKAYLDFICHTLKPYIDAHYATLPDREHTAMMGSSMGALVSVYAAAYCPEYFGCCMGLSFPSLDKIWSLQAAALRENTDTLTRLYIDTGDAGLDAEFFPAFHELEPILQANGYNANTLMVKVFPSADHNETCWSHRLSLPLRFAFDHK